MLDRVNNLLDSLIKNNSSRRLLGTAIADLCNANYQLGFSDGFVVGGIITLVFFRKIL